MYQIVFIYDSYYNTKYFEISTKIYLYLNLLYYNTIVRVKSRKCMSSNYFIILTLIRSRYFLYEQKSQNKKQTNPSLK